MRKADNTAQYLSNKDGKREVTGGTPMQELSQMVRALDCLYRSETLAEYDQARQTLEAQIKQILPGFTLAYALEVGTVGAGDTTYQHGGVAHVLLPIQKQMSI